MSTLENQQPIPSQEQNQKPVLKPIINKKVLTRLKKGEVDKTSVMYVVISLIVFCFVVFYISSQVKYLIVIGNKFIVNGMHKTIVEKQYDFDTFDKLKGYKSFD